VERLLNDSPDESFRILALSYTVKAADELAQRFQRRLGELWRRVDADTVHGFAHSLLRSHGTRIGLTHEPEILVRDEDRAELLGRWLSAEGRSVPDDLMALLLQLDLARAQLESAPLLAEWESALAGVGALDYGRMLALATELVELQSTHRQLARLYAHVIVDEAQNLTAAQYQFLKALVGSPGTDATHVPMMIVGDEKQSIVRFAGADPQFISQFEAEYKAQRFELRQNFRSAAAIVALGDVVAERLGQRRSEGQTTLYAAPGLVEFYEAVDEDEEARYVSTWVSELLDRGVPQQALAPGESGHVRPDEIAVLGRSAAALRPTQKALEMAGRSPAMSSSADAWLETLAGKIAFEIVALRSAVTHQSTHWQLARLLGADEIEVASPEALEAALSAHSEQMVRFVAPLSSIASPEDFIGRLAELEIPGEPGDQALAAWDADCRQLMDAWRSFVQQTDRVEQTWGNFRIHVSRKQRGDELDPGVRLITIHKAQGREYRAVALVGLNDGQLPDFRATGEDEQVSELRTFYVAVTRASRLLLLTRAKSRSTRYGPRLTDPSPFLKLL
jgi:DNA helicase-2/ATP-dependent DNA helicase PcrA